MHASLRRLQTDYIDLYQAHCFDYGTPLEETLAAFDALVTAGKVRYVGVSNFKGYQLQKISDTARQLGTMAIVSLQPLYNMIDRSLEWEIVEVCLREGWVLSVEVAARRMAEPARFRRGMDAPLPGVGRIEVAEQQGRMENWNAYNNERTWKIIDALLQVAEAHGVSGAQVA